MSYQSNLNETRPSPQDFESLSRYFLNVPANIVKKIFKATTQYAQSGWIMDNIRNTIKSPFLALNFHRRHELVATDTIIFDTPAVDDEATCDQLFVGMSKKYCEV